VEEPGDNEPSVDGCGDRGGEENGTSSRGVRSPPQQFGGNNATSSEFYGNQNLCFALTCRLESQHVALSAMAKTK